MKPEYQQIVDEAMESFSSAVSNRNLMLAAITLAVERCEALANKPVRELTDKEILDAWQRGCGLGVELHKHDYRGARAIIDAHIEKQSEPDEIPFDQKKLDEGGWWVKVHYKNGDATIGRYGFEEQDSITKVTLVRK